MQLGKGRSEWAEIRSFPGINLLTSQILISSLGYTLTATKRDTSLGKQRPVVSPNGVLVAIQPNSSRISAPIRVEEMRPMTKKQVLSNSLVPI